MSRRINPERGALSPRSGGGPDGGLLYVILGGLALLLVLSGWSLSELRNVRKELGEKTAQLETKIAQIQTAPAQQQPRRGPDPNRAYPIKTEGSPAKGSAAAPVTIAEFSDFQ